MNHPILLEMVLARIPDAKEDLADINRAVLYKNDLETFNRLNFEDDNAFLNPSLFHVQHLTPEYNNLGALLFAQCQDDLKPDEIEVYVDHKGRAYFHELGYVYTDAKSTRVKLQWDASARRFDTLNSSGTSVLRQEAPFYYGDTHVEIYQDDVPQYYEVFSQPELTSTHTDRLFQQNQDAVVKAISVIQDCYPNFYKTFASNIRGVYMFSHEQCRSFAVQALTGVSFLNSEPEHSVIFFLEDIIHQSSHNIFYLVLFQKDIFTMDEEDDLENYSDHPLAHGQVYGTFHGLFTLCNINTCFELCLQDELFSGDLLLELRGRFSDNMKRFKAAIEIFDDRKLFADEGWKLYQSLKETWAGLYQRNKSLIEAYDTSNQPYVFRMDKFLEANPVA